MGTTPTAHNPGARTSRTPRSARTTLSANTPGARTCSTTPVVPERIDQPTPEVRGGGATHPERQATLSDTEGLRHSHRTQRPPGYLWEYYCGRVEGGPFSTAPQGSKPTHGRGPLEDTQHLFLSNTQLLWVAAERLQVPDGGQNSAQSSRQASTVDEEKTLQTDSGHQVNARQTIQALRQQTRTLIVGLEDRINEEVKQIDEDVEQLEVQEQEVPRSG